MVDVIAYSAYRWGGENVFEVAGGVAATLRTFAPDKPYLLAQTAAGASASRDQWIRDLFSWAASDPNMIGLVWFNQSKEQDWRVWTSPNGPGLAAGWRGDTLPSARPGVSRTALIAALRRGPVSTRRCLRHTHTGRSGPCIRSRTLSPEPVDQP